MKQLHWQLLQLFSEEPEAAPGEECADAGHGETGRMSWEQIVKDPEYNARIQKIVRSRVNDQGRNKAILETLSPALRQLAQEHGLDPEHIDHAALAEKITGQQKAPDPRAGFRRHMESLRQQEARLQEVVPGFELRKELRNPLFARLTSPGVGLSVEDAFYTVHRREMQQRSMQVAAQKTQQLISNAIQSGSHRPQEAGAQAPTLTRFDYRSASPEQRLALKQEIRKAAAEGRKVYPG